MKTKASKQASKKVIQIQKPLKTGFLKKELGNAGKFNKNK
jgi:hypothetical protein